MHNPQESVLRHPRLILHCSRAPGEYDMNIPYTCKALNPFTIKFFTEYFTFFTLTGHNTQSILIQGPWAFIEYLNLRPMGV